MTHRTTAVGDALRSFLQSDDLTPPPKELRVVCANEVSLEDVTTQLGDHWARGHAANGRQLGTDMWTLERLAQSMVTACRPDAELSPEARAASILKEAIASYRLLYRTASSEAAHTALTVALQYAVELPQEEFEEGWGELGRIVYMAAWRTLNVVALNRSIGKEEVEAFIEQSVKPLALALDQATSTADRKAALNSLFKALLDWVKAQGLTGDTLDNAVLPFGNMLAPLM